MSEAGGYQFTMKNGDNEIIVNVSEAEVAGKTKAELTDLLYKKMEEGRSEMLRRGGVLS